MKVKRFTALLIAAVMAISLLPAPMFSLKAEAAPSKATIVAWNFDSETNAPSESDAVNAGLSLAREDATIAFSYTAGQSGGKALNSSYWNDATLQQPKYYTVTVNAANYADINVSAQTTDKSRISAGFVVSKYHKTALLF